MKTSLHVLTESSIQTKQNKRKQVGILGGTFSPPHIGHLIMADQVYHQLGLDCVYFMPDFVPPHVDKKEAIGSEHRVEMVKQAIQHQPHFELELCEIERGGKSYTVNTMKELIAQHPDTDYYFIIGGDMVNYLPKWYKIDELIQLVQFVGVGRPHYTKESSYPVLWVDSPEIDVSSTLLRERIAADCTVRYLIPDEVLAYIQEKGLYQK